MPTWRSSELEALLGGPLDAAGITEAAFDRLVREQVIESDQIDFKRGSYGPSARPRQAWTDEQEFAKDVAAFANQRGGLLVPGIEDVAGVATRLDPIPNLAPETEERRLRQALHNYQAPLAECWFVWVEAAAGGRYIAVIVPPSRRSPHAVLGDRDDQRRPLRYPVRHGPDTIWLTEPEVAERYRRQHNAQRDEAERVHQVVMQGCEMLRTASGVWLFIAVIPEAPAEGSLDQAMVESIDTWYAKNRPNSPVQLGLPAYGRPIPAPGKVTFTGSLRSASEDETVVRDAYLELYVDGSAFGATPVAARTDQDGDGRLIGEITLVDDSILLCDVTVGWCARQVGAWGTATAVIGLVEVDRPAGAVTEPVVLAHADTGQLRRVHATRELSGHPEARTALDLGAVDTLQQRLAVAYNLLAGLLQWFGLAEPTQLKPNGAIVARQFLMTRYRAVVAWAVGNGVEVERLPGD